MNNIVSITNSVNAFNTAIVESVKDGRASRVLWTEKSSSVLPVYGHLSHVPAVEKFDEVLVQDTEKGVVVVGVIVSNQQPPAARIEEENGVVTVRGAKAVRLETEQASIEVTSDGKVAVDGKQIYQQAEQAMTLKGYPIELN
ncbi:hypothetical protein [Pleionea mediterranea]|jgi:hypothetical protein|uniref:Bacteriophage Mu Gp45 protein n=1 Tax=Pleionea mediterranea TaxID=523701 RepID=A0A316F6R3_9GAMM|nr:hypothetical protein [Pleionea mediterranea]PWK42538.1 hypothetical protein C8D97_1187 [Pleionea mediterranea]